MHADMNQGTASELSGEATDLQEIPSPVGSVITNCFLFYFFLCNYIIN